MSSGQAIPPAHDFGKIGDGRLFHALPADLDRAYALAGLSTGEQLILQYVREVSEAPAHLNKTAPEPCEMNLVELARSWGGGRAYYSRQRSSLVQAGFLIESSPQRFILGKDINRWIEAKRIKPEHIPLIVDGYRSRVQTKEQRSDGPTKRSGSSKRPRKCDQSVTLEASKCDQSVTPTARKCDQSVTVEGGKQEPSLCPISHTGCDQSVTLEASKCDQSVTPPLIGTGAELDFKKTLLDNNNSDLEPSKKLVVVDEEIEPFHSPVDEQPLADLNQPLSAAASKRNPDGRQRSGIVNDPAEVERIASEADLKWPRGNVGYNIRRFGGSLGTDEAVTYHAIDLECAFVRTAIKHDKDGTEDAWGYINGILRDWKRQSGSKPHNVQVDLDSIRSRYRPVQKKVRDGYYDRRKDNLYDPH